MVSNAHICFFQDHPFDDYSDTIQRLPLIHYLSTLESLRSRYTSLLAMASELPDSLSMPETLDKTKTTTRFASILSDPFAENASPAAHSAATPADGTPPLNETALFLALFGWQAEDDHIAGLATCNACFRRLGLWLFKTPSDSSSDASMERLDVISEHRDYCPWINPILQNGATRRSSSDGLSGWETLVRTIMSRTTAEPSERSGTEQHTTQENIIGAENGSTSVNTDPVAEEEEHALRTKKDKERFAKLKRVSQIFRVKSKRSSMLEVKRPSTAT